MKLCASKVGNGYDILMLDEDPYPHNAAMDNEIAQYLNLTHEEYKNILYKHNSIDCGPTRITFNDKSDAEVAIKILEPFLILAILTEG